jgi:thiamine-phosphate pyrophosphorylase
MLPELTPAVTRALEAAKAYARAAAADHVGPLHILLGLLEEEEGGACAFAVQAGLDLAAWRSAFANRPTSDSAAQGQLPLDTAAADALEEARGLARQITGESTVAGESLLLALVRGAPLRTELERFGMRSEDLEAELGRRRIAPVELDEPLRLADVTESVDVARLIDAGANRAREALRVVEDYCRFVLDDAFLCGQLKQMRHDLTAALGQFAPDDLLAARETQRDVGTSLSTEAEQERGSTREVLQANLKRLQEALRSLEEFGKVRSPRLGQSLEQIRYRSYTIERALLLGSAARARLREVRLCVLLSRSTCAAALDWTIAEAAAGGARMVQLREKGVPDRELLETARQVRRWTHKAGVLFIVNDRPDIARLAEADGVHLGQDDLPVKEARRILGPDVLVGVSTHELGQARQAVLDGASYLGVGPSFPSGTKSFAVFPGPEFIRAAAAETTLPAFAIGGINAATIASAAAAGARRAAVGQAIAQADDPRAAAAALLRALTAEAR